MADAGVQPSAPDRAERSAAVARSSRRARRSTSTRTTSPSATSTATSTTSACASRPVSPSTSTATVRSRAAFERLLARRDRARRLQPAGAARRADLVAGEHRCAATRSSPIRPGSRSASRYVEDTLARLPQPRRPCSSSCSRRVSTRRSTTANGSQRSRRPTHELLRGLDEVPSLDDDRIVRHVPVAGQGHTPHQCVPRPADDCVQVRPVEGSRPARAAPGVRDLRVLASGSRACTSAVVRSLAAGCGGATDPRTTAPRCSVWSRPRW